MINTFSSPTFDDQLDEELDFEDEYPKVTQADLDRAKFRVGLQPVPPQQKITIRLDTALIEYFKAQAGESGYQALINEALRRAVVQADMEETLRRVIREELHTELHPTNV
ncbi:MAG: BrnA antitoxin family protein [Caldilineaceae bacterium]